MAGPACLVGEFEFTRSASERKGSIMSALGQSVSFGRYLSESMDWERWSTFSHNKYIEEAEQASRPGSVAQKKAFFEEHYRRKAAAAAVSEEAGTAPNSCMPAPGDQERSSSDGHRPADLDPGVKDGSLPDPVGIAEKEPLKDIGNADDKKSKGLGSSTDRSPSSSAKKMPSLHSAKENNLAAAAAAAAAACRGRTGIASLHMSMNFGPLSRTEDYSCSKGESFKGVRGKIAHMEAVMNGSKSSLGQPGTSSRKVLMSFGTETPRVPDGKRNNTANMAPAKKIAPNARSSSSSVKHITNGAKEAHVGNTSSRALLCPRPNKMKELESSCGRENGVKESGPRACFRARPLPNFYSKTKATRDPDRKVTAEYTKLGLGVPPSAELGHGSVTSPSHAFSKRRACCFNLRNPQ